jgi:two-component system sensor histidine kinase YesM
MSKPRPSKRFSTIIILVFSIFIVTILVVMSIVSYYYSYTNMRNRTIADTEVILMQAGKNIGRYISSIEGISGFINSNTELIKYLSDGYGSAEKTGASQNGAVEGAEAERLRSSYENILRYVPELADGIASVFIFDNRNNVVYKPEGLEFKEGFDITQEDWYKKVFDNDTNQPEITSTQVRIMTKKENPWVISISSRIVDDGGNVLGTQLIELNYRAIEEIGSDINLGTRGYVFIVDSDGNIVYHPPLQLIYSGLKNENIEAILNAESSVLELPEENKFYNIITVPGTDFEMVGVMFMDEIVATAKDMIFIYIILVLTMALAAFIGAVQMTAYAQSPCPAGAGGERGGAGQPGCKLRHKGYL